MAVSIRIVSSKADLRRFVKYPFTLYRDCDQWVPPLIRNAVRTLRADRNPAFEHCRSVYWLAYRNGTLSGRIAGIISDRYNEKWNHRYARFGWVDFIDDAEVSSALFGAVEQWAREQGMNKVHGPMGFTGMDAEGLLVEGFNELGTIMDVFSFPYYASHLEALGYRKDTDWVEYEVRVPESIPDKAIRVGQLVLKRYNLKLVHATSAKELLPYGREVFDLVNEAYSHIYGSVELTPAQISAYTKEYFGYVNPEFNKVIVDNNGRLVAFGLVLPSLSRALQKAQGRLLPFGFMHLMRAMKNPRQLDLGLIAVRPDFQAKGIPAILITEITRAAIQHGIASAETGRELEDNIQVRSLWKSFDARQHKRRRVYLKSLE